jgi:hypothetical protein
MGFDAACLARSRLHKLEPSAKENPMPERVNAFAPMIPRVFAVLVAMIAVHFCRPVRAECIEQPNPPAAEGTHWSLHYDRAKGKRCWILVDGSTNGHDGAAAQAQPNATPGPVESISSQIASLFGNLTGASANAPQVNGPQTSPATGPRKPQGNAANASKADNGVRADQRSTGEGHAAKRASSGLTQGKREELFEEFLRWRESQQIIGTPSRGPAPR